jgi:hypothetical protein
MKKPSWLKIAGAAITLVTATSCYVAPYGYGGYSTSVGYSSGYYGGGGGYSSTTFVYTSDSRWLYDPVVFCYYDRYRGCYYDPYAYGYYPVGYCPRPIYGAPHPHGWNGRGTPPPPPVYRDRRLSNYDNRAALYRSQNLSWSSRVRVDTNSSDSWRNQRVNSARGFSGNSGPSQQSRPSYNTPVSTPSRPAPSQSSPWTRPSYQQGYQGSNRPEYRPTANNTSYDRPGFQPSAHSSNQRPQYGGGASTQGLGNPRPQSEPRPARNEQPKHEGNANREERLKRGHQEAAPF